MDIRLEDGAVISVPDGSSEEEINSIIDDYERDMEASRNAERKAASDKRRDDFLAQQEANADPTVAFDRVRPRYLDGVVGEDWGRSIDAGLMGWAEQADDIIRGVQRIIGDDETDARLDREAAAADRYARDTYRGSNGFASDVGDFMTTAPSMLFPGGLIVQSLLGGAEAALDQEEGDSPLLDFGVGTILSGTFGKMFDLAGRLVGNGWKTWRGDKTLTGELGETQQKAVDFADQEGVEILPSQRTGNSTREQWEAKAESQPYGERLRDIRAKQERELNDIFFQRFGIEGATEYSDSVRRAVDNKITNTFNEVKAEIPTTKSDETFLYGVTDITTRRTLDDSQVKMLEEIALDVADGMEANKLLDTRKQLQTAIVDAYNNGNSTFGNALRDMVDEIDNLVERTASAETALKYADARDMSRMRMALEMGAGTNAKGELNQTTLANRLFKIYRNELGRGRGGLDERTQRSVDAAQAASVFKTGIGNSGTTTRGAQDFTQTAIDQIVRKPMTNLYLNAPWVYDLNDPVGDLWKAASYRAGRGMSGGYGDAQDVVSGLFNFEREEER